MDNSIHSVCKICNQQLSGVDEFYAHLRTHKMPRSTYFTTYYPRFDLLTNERIPFKNEEYYFSTYFLLKENLSVWLRKQSVEDQIKFCKTAIQERKERKSLVYAPCQVEARSTMIPSVLYMERLFNYYEFCAEIGLRNKFTKCNNIVPHKTYDEMRGTPLIFVDTREQRPLRFKLDTESKKLDYGDYAFVDEEWTQKCHIERKSLTDFISTLSGGLERFTNEIKRAQDDDARLVVLVEESLSTCLAFNEHPDIPSNIRATPEFIFKNVRDLIQQFSCVQFLFVNGRTKAAEVIEKIFTYGVLHALYDLQCLYDKSLL